MRLNRVVVILLLLAAATGCRSRVIHLRLVNTSSQPVSTIIVDYPRATFGVNSLAAGKTFNYVIKPTERGALKIQFTDAQGASHTYTGPVVQKGQEGEIEIKLTQDSVSAAPVLR
jgi:hypothetical protein